MCTWSAAEPNAVMKQRRVYMDANIWHKIKSNVLSNMVSYGVELHIFQKKLGRFRLPPRWLIFYEAPNLT